MKGHNPRLSKNNFDLLRLLFASTVCLVHAQQLSGHKALLSITSFLSSEVAVNGFFVLSGFLIFMSYERSSSLFSYFHKRIRRIYPAYFVVVISCASLFFWVSTQSGLGYFSMEWVRYVLANLSFLNFLQPTLPGVFEHNTMVAINGALWTIKIEVMFYISVPIFSLLYIKFGRFKTLATVYCLSIFYTLFCEFKAQQTGNSLYLILARQLPAQLSFFLSGAFFYYYLDRFVKHIGYFVVAAILVIGINSQYPLPLFEPFALATLVIFFGIYGYLGNFGKYGDFSYGVYIIHFPTIQLLLHFNWMPNNPWMFLLTVIVCTGTGAVLMWHYIEKNFLLRNSHYINTSKRPNKT